MHNDLTFFTTSFFSGNPDVQRLETDVNTPVYALYALTPAVIAIVEGKK